VVLISACGFNFRPFEPHLSTSPWPAASIMHRDVLIASRPVATIFGPAGLISTGGLNLGLRP